MSDLNEWKKIATHATSGDQVWDILADWKKSEDTLRKQLEIAVEALKQWTRGDELSIIAGDALAEIDKLSTDNFMDDIDEFISDS